MFSWLLGVATPGTLTAALMLSLPLQASERGIVILAVVVASALTLASDPQHRGWLTAILWGVAGLGAALQLRLHPEMAAIELAGLLVGAAVVLITAAVGVQRLRRREQVVPLPVLLLATLVLIVLRVLPAFFGTLDSGLLPLPLIGSVQVGEFVRPGATVLLALLLTQVFRGHVSLHSSGARIVAWVTGGLLVLLPLLMAVVDAGPAMIMLLGFATVWLLETSGQPLLKRVALPIGIVGAGALVSIAAVRWVPWVRDSMLNKVELVRHRFFGTEALNAPPEVDVYQLNAGLHAIAEGGAIGRGLGSSVLAHIIPIADSDMLFAVLGADFGLLIAGTVVVILVLALRAVFDGIDKRAGDPWSVASRAILVMVVIQLAWSVLAVLGFVPLTGVSAPLLVVSGSALWGTTLSLGIAFGSTMPGQSGFAPEEPMNSTARVIREGLSLIAAILVVAAVVGVFRPWNTGSAGALIAPRGEILTADGKVIAETDIHGERVYPGGADFAEVTGRAWGLQGQSGLEESLSGELGCGGHIPWWRYVEVVLHPLPCSPASVVTTVDSRLQQLATAHLSDAMGAAAVYDTETGDVLVLASTGTGDPNSWLPKDKDSIARFASWEPIAPGSVVKPLVAGVGLTGGFDTAGLEDFSVDLGGVEIHNSGDAHCLDTSIAGALQQSCNTPFAALAMLMGGELLEQGIAKHYGASGGFDLDGVPVFGVDPGISSDSPIDEVARASFGQGNYRATPLGVAVATGHLINALDERSARRPRLVAGVCRAPGTFDARPSQPAENVPLRQADADIIYQGMGAVLAHNGTLGQAADWAATVPFEVVAKSGTAEVPANVSASGLAHWITIVVDRRFVIVTQVRDTTPNGAAEGAALALTTAQAIAEGVAEYEPAYVVLNGPESASAEFSEASC